MLSVTIFRIFARFRALALAAGLAVTASSAAAAPVAIVNAGFEDVTGQTVFNEFTFGTPAGWTMYDPNGISGGAAFFPGTLTPNGTDFFNATAPEGSRVGILFNFNPGNDTGEYGFEQTLAATLQANTRYELSVEVGNIASGTATNNDFFNLDGFPGYRVDLLAGGTVIASDLDTLVIPEGEFLTATVSIDIGLAHANLGDPLGIRLVNLNATPAGLEGDPTLDLEVDFDDVRLEAFSIHAPGAALLLAAAVVAMTFRRRKT